jgi:hypothetical protein
MMQQGRYRKIVEVLLILIQFEYVADKLVTESEDISEILVYFSIFILFYDICSDMTGEHGTRNNNQMEGSSQH